MKPIKYLSNIKHRFLNSEFSIQHSAFFLLPFAFCILLMSSAYGATIGGTVVMADGITPVKGALVEVKSDVNAVAAASGNTDDAGNFSISGFTAGTWIVKITPPASLQEICYEKLSVPVVFDNDQASMAFTTPLKLTYKPIKSVYCFVTLGGIPQENVEVTAFQVDKGGEPDSFKTDASGTTGLIIFGGEDWKFSVKQTDGANWLAPDPQIIRFPDTPTKEFLWLYFSLLPASGSVSGRILSQGGTVLGDYSGIQFCAVDPISYYTKCAAPGGAGNFTLTLPRGSYDTYLEVSDPIYSSPELPSVSVAASPVNMGDIRLVSRETTIGVLTKNAEEEGISGIGVSIWQEGKGFYQGTTDALGVCWINVSSGIWMVKPENKTAAYLYTGPATEVYAPPDKTVTVEFTMQAVENQINGTVKDVAGNVLTDVKATAYARTDASPKPVSETEVFNGQFTLNVPAGSYKVGLSLPVGSPYALTEEVSLLRGVPKGLTPAETAMMRMSLSEKMVNAYPRVRDALNVNIVLKSNDAVIIGTFKDKQGKPVTDVPGSVLAVPEASMNASQTADIDTSTGKYSLKVSKGKWSLTYKLITDKYIINPMQPVSLDVSGNVTQDFSPAPTGGIVKGIIYDIDGKTPKSNVLVWARYFAGKNLIEQRQLSDIEGKYEFSFPDGVEIVLGTDLNGNETNTVKRDLSANPKDIPITATRSMPPSAAVSTESSLRPPAVNKTGQITDQNGKPAAGATVSAISNDGQKSSDVTDQNGNFSLSLAKPAGSSGNTVTISAVATRKPPDIYSSDYKPGYAQSDDASAGVMDTGAVQLKLGTEKPLSSAESDDFQAVSGATKMYSDGTRIAIPEKAFAVQTGTMNISLSPRVGGLPDNTQSRLIGYAYDMAVREKTTGKSVTPPFTRKLTVTLRYSDAEMLRLKAADDDVHPAYFSSVTNSWQIISDYTVDKTDKSITFTTDHLSVWGLVAAQSVKLTKGDINNDGKVDLTDAILGLQVCAQLNMQTTNIFPIVADVDGDQRIGLTEVNYILQVAAGVR